MNISFIGFGNMAQAIAHRLSQQGSYSLSAASPSLPVGTDKNGIHTHHNNKEVVNHAEIIILAVKPAQMNEVLQEIMPFISSECLLISVAAGLSLEWFKQRCKSNQPVIRTMPNTPASIGLAATPMIANAATSTKQRKQAEAIFSQIGITTWANNEDEMDAFTALSGSGPAYVFSFIDALAQAAVSLGLNESIAKIFALQTVHGATQLAHHNDLSFIELKTKVTSPGGTTAAALHVLDDPLHALIIESMKAAKKRAHELGAVN